MRQGIYGHGVFGKDGRYEHELVQPPRAPGHLDDLRQEVVVPFRVDYRNVVPFLDILGDHVLDQPRFADACRPEAEKVGLAHIVGDRNLLGKAEDGFSMRVVIYAETGPQDGFARVSAGRVIFLL